MSAVVNIRPPQTEDIIYLAENMRAEDVQEVEALTDDSFLDVINTSIRLSLNAYTAEYEGKVLALFGMSGIALGQSGCIWMLGTTSLEKHTLSFIRYSLSYIRRMQAQRSLFNYVHVDNVKTIKWLKWLGFSLDKPRPFGVKGENFILFRGAKCA